MNERLNRANRLERSSEPVEQRGPAKGNGVGSTTVGTQRPAEPCRAVWTPYAVPRDGMSRSG
jgi:hypothetical protein